MATRGEVVTIAMEIVLVTEICYKCQMRFAMPRAFQRLCYEKGETFYCPMGHAQVYAEPEVKRIKRELGEAQERVNVLEYEKMKLKQQVDGALDAVAKTQKRIKSGVCPFCHRHFNNVERHMKTKHPCK